MNDLPKIREPQTLMKCLRVCYIVPAWNRFRYKYTCSLKSLAVKVSYEIPAIEVTVFVMSSYKISTFWVAVFAAVSYS